MPKRKHSKNDSIEVLSKKLKRIERRLERKMKEKRPHKRPRVLSSSSSSHSSPERRSETRECTIPIYETAIPMSEPIHLIDHTIEAASSESHENVVNCMDDANPASFQEASNDVTTTELDPDLLDILGVDPSKQNSHGKDIQKDVAVRFEHVATVGLSKQDRKDLTEKHLVPGNCKLINAPALNAEIKAALSETVIKRDKAIESKQKILASAMSSLGEAITLILSFKEINPDLLRLLVDTGRLMSDCQHNDTIARRNFIIYSVKKDMKECLQETKIDNFLFGSNLPDTLKAAKAISKSGSELKVVTAPKSVAIKKNWPSSSKNWKGSHPSRKPPPATSKPKDMTLTHASTRSQRAASSKQWAPPPGPRSRR